jgi:3-oxoacyl-[acyl-carrier-protein] synthase-3
MNSGLGVRIAGTGRHVPEGVLTNSDLAKMVNTSDEWITQRTGIKQRYICDPEKGETTRTISARALEKALKDAGMEAQELDLVIVASVTGEMRCPATACRVAADLGAGNAGAFDLMAACSGFVYGLQLANDMIRCGSMKNVAVIGCDVMSRVVDYEDRTVCVLFGDSAGAVILKADEDPSRGLQHGRMHANGSGWKDLYIPERDDDFPKDVDSSLLKRGVLHMHGREVYKFAVGTFPRLIEETLELGGVGADDIDMYVCHQSNARMLESARERIGIPSEKMYINIDRYGNCSAGSVPVCLDELREQGACKDGDLVMFVAFGGGLTWASALWRI